MFGKVRSRVGALVVAALVGMSSFAAGSETGPQLGVNIGLIYSADYHDLLADWADANNYDSAGGYGWLSLGMEVNIPIVAGLSIVPAADFMVNFVLGDENAVNYIILPSVVARYQFGIYSGPFVQAGFNKGIVKLGLDGLDAIESDGIGIEAQVGYQFGRHFGLELGYRQVPVKAGRFRRLPYDDMGGPEVRFALSF
jgi:hypothetical protein